MKNRMAVILLCSIVLVMTLSACGAVKDLSAVNDAGDAFMTALRDGDVVTSWNMLTTEVQTEIGDIASWQDFVIPRNFSEWKFSNTQVENDVAQLDGEATLGADSYSIVLVFQKVDDYWLLSGINFTYVE
jgi:hypothetical protein